jgi:DNA repair photolyase
MFRLVKLVEANPPSPWRGHTEWEVEPPHADLRVFVDDSASILSRNDSPDLHFRWSCNPYRGCFHACAYCYARPSHEYLGLGAGSDFERKLLVKPEAAHLLRVALASPRWVPEVILFSGNTDCYQPLELRYRLTRACLEVCRDRGNPVGVITKAALVARDADVLSEMAGRGLAQVTFSIPFADPVACRAIEPGAPPPARRFAAMAALHAVGVPVGVNIAPVIPGLNDRDIPELLKAARAAGASWASVMPVRLPGAVEAVFRERLAAAFPERSAAVLAKVRRMRGGALNEARFGERFRGGGAEWEATLALFRVWRARLGFPERQLLPASPAVTRKPRVRPVPGTPGRPAVPDSGAQLGLFSGRGGG